MNNEKMKTMTCIKDVPLHILLDILNFVQSDGFRVVVGHNYPVWVKSQKSRRVLRMVCKLFKEVLDSGQYWKNWKMIYKGAITSKEESFFRKCNVWSLQITSCDMGSLQKPFGFKIFENLRSLTLLNSSPSKIMDILVNLEGYRLEFLEFFLKSTSMDLKSLDIFLETVLLPVADNLKGFSFGFDDLDRYYTYSEGRTKQPFQMSDAFMKLLDRLPKLCNISLRNSKCSSVVHYLLKEDAELTPEIVASLQKLKHLEYNATVSIMELQEVFDVCNGDISLTSLKIPFINAAGIDRKIKKILQIQDCSTSITTLKIHLGSLQPCGIEKIIDSLRKLKNLRELSLTNGINLSTNQAILIAVNCGGLLKRLTLSRCFEIKDECLYNLKEQYPKLLYLDVTHCDRLNLHFLSQNYGDTSKIPCLRKVVLSGVRSIEGADEIIHHVREVTKNQLRVACNNPTILFC